MVVWLSTNHWSTALGRRPLLKYGVLCHLANRTLSFHGIADDAVGLLIFFVRRMDKLFNHPVAISAVVPSVDPFKRSPSATAPPSSEGDARKAIDAR